MLQWNVIRYINPQLISFFLKLSIEFYTRVLTCPSLSDERLFRLNLINDLYVQGMVSRQIAGYLNGHGIVTPRGGGYTPNLVCVTQKKFTDRIEQISDLKWPCNGIAPMTRVEVKTLKESSNIVLSVPTTKPKTTMH